ncbi:hypothetical protein [Azospirillum sp. SYSU D00513]|uniref:hypothetical protein n=1 Tax=Azospirillum sp. SYSU D00513 TaxID=2812561 RepID=UPI001A977FAE|nr:hypothetical protein [Azospirillum sp. SYSU D00513]
MSRLKNATLSTSHALDDDGDGLTEALSLLSDLDNTTLARIVRELEVRRVLGWKAMSVRSGPLDRLLNILGRRIPPRCGPRLQTVSRLAFAPAELLFANNDDARPWSVPRSMLRAIWALAYRTAPERISDLCNRYAAAVTAAQGVPDPEVVLLTASAAQLALRDILGEVIRQPAAVEAVMLEILRLGGVAGEGAVGPRTYPVLESLWLALEAQHRAGGTLLDVARLLQTAAAKQSWRESIDMDQAMFAVGQALPVLLADVPPGHLGRSPAAAFFVLLGRALEHPSPLLEILRRRVILETGGQSPRDTRCSAEMLAYVEDLVGSVEMQADRTAQSITDVRSSQNRHTARLKAGDDLFLLSRSLKRIDSVGFLDPRGRPREHLEAVRKRFVGRPAANLLEALSGLACGPMFGMSPESTGGEAVTAAVCAATLVCAIGDVADGLQCRAAAKTARNSILAAVQRQADDVLGRMPAEEASWAARWQATLAVAEVLSPSLAETLRRRQASSKNATASNLKANPSTLEVHWL